MPAPDDPVSLAHRAYLEFQAVAGVPITNDFGQQGTCVTGTIERKRSAQAIALLGQAITKADMLAEDFDTLGLIATQSHVTIDGIRFAILTIDRDPIDPCVHFTMTSDIVT